MIESYVVKYNVFNDGNGIEISYGYGDDTLIVRLCKRGGNNLFDFRKIFTSKEILFDSTASDWHSPFIVKAFNNIDGDNVDSGYFTGGNHQTNNSYTGGAPTARGVSLLFLADGKLLNANDSGTANCVEMRWTNLIQAYNTSKADGTGREVLQENHTLKFINGKFEANVELIALEPILMSRYYGLQSVLNSYPKIRFINGGSRKEFLVANNVSSSGITTSAIECYSDNHKLTIEIDPTLDLGKRDSLFI